MLVHMPFLSQPPPFSPEGFVLVYKAWWGWDGAQREGGPGEGASEENRKRSLRKAIDRTLIA